MEDLADGLPDGHPDHWDGPTAGGDCDGELEHAEERKANNSYEDLRQEEDEGMSTDNGGVDSEEEGVNPLDSDRDRVLTALLMAAQEDPSTAIRETSNRFQQIREFHDTSHAAARGTWQWAWRFCEVLSIIKKRSAGVPAVSYKASRALATPDLPKVRITTVHYNLLTGGYELVKGVSVYPDRRYENRNIWQLVYDIAECSLERVVEHFRSDHPQVAIPLSLQLSLDGVPEPHSGGRNIDVLSVKVEGCA
jgi:hypothetical protein